MKIRPCVKRCDKCKRLTSKHRIIYRYAIHKHFPYYDYEGFDLCEDCEKKFIKMLRRFFK